MNPEDRIVIAVLLTLSFTSFFAVLAVYFVRMNSRSVAQSRQAQGTDTDTEAQ